MKTNTQTKHESADAKAMADTKASAEKLAEAGQHLENAVSDLLNERPTLEIQHYAETALHEWKAALAQWEAGQ